MAVNYNIDLFTHNPAILADKDEIHFNSNLIHNIGDGIIISGHKVTITNICYNPDYPTRKIHAGISGNPETIMAIRELLTFK